MRKRYYISCEDGWFTVKVRRFGFWFTAKRPNGGGAHFFLRRDAVSFIEGQLDPQTFLHE